MLWRAPLNSSYKYAVDAEGRLILAQWEDNPSPQVLRLDEYGGIDITSRSGEQLPELNEWGNSPTTAALADDGANVAVDYDGEHYVITGIDDEPIIPELPNYQP